MARLHIACWREAYAGIVPSETLDRADVVQRASIWRSNISDPERFVLAAFDGDRPVGFVLARANDDPAIAGADGQVAAIYVLASHYRLKLGSRLLAAAARWWKQRGGTALGLSVLAGNDRALAFYLARGGRIAQTSTYVWDGTPLPNAIVIFDDLAKLAAAV